MTERIHVDAHGLTRAHVLQLGLLEICRHPDVVDGNDSKQTLARLNPLAEFDDLAANDSADRGIDFRVANIKFCRAHIRSGSLQLSDARFRLGLSIHHLLGSRSCLLHLCLPLGDKTASCSGLLPNGSDGGTV